MDIELNKQYKQKCKTFMSEHGLEYVDNMIDYAEKSASGELKDKNGNNVIIPFATAEFYEEFGHCPTYIDYIDIEEGLFIIGAVTQDDERIKIDFSEWDFTGSFEEIYNIIVAITDYKNNLN